MINTTAAFRLRAFVAFLLAFSSLLSALSGLILFVRPEGSIAAWTGWSALGLDKKGWEGLHAVFVLVLVVSAAIHLLYNWRTLAAYCRRRKDNASTAGLGPWRELIAAAMLVALVLAGCLGKWLPVRLVVDLRGMFKNGAAAMKAPPPVADADKLTLAELCPVLGVGGEELLKAARRKGLRVERLSQTLAEVAKLNGSTPEKTFILLKGR